MAEREKLLRDVAFAYVRHSEMAAQASARGDETRRDEHFSVVQEIERCVTVIENSRAWRNPRSQRPARLNQRNRV